MISRVKAAWLSVPIAVKGIAMLAVVAVDNVIYQVLHEMAITTMFAIQFVIGCGTVLLVLTVWKVVERIRRRA